MNSGPGRKETVAAAQAAESRGFVVRPSARLGGAVQVPGDKSISHRAVMLAGIADGVSRVRGFLNGEDCLATLAAMRAMGVRAEQLDRCELRIHGLGLHGLRAPSGPLDLGNSGTGLRLLAGLLCGQSFDSVITGDASLLGRPMGRIAEPLNLMGASIETREGKPPMNITGGRALTGIDYRLPVASAQVKSALLLAGLYASGPTRVTEPGVTRDHTERMLRSMGCDVSVDGATAIVEAPGKLEPVNLAVPGDFSSAAFFIVAGLLGAAEGLTVYNVGINPTRTGLLAMLERMGGDIRVEQKPSAGDEPLADIHVKKSCLRGIDVPPELVPLAIDEFPVFFIAAALAEGTTRVTGASELRYKESDRIAVMADGLARLGVDARPQPDGLEIDGGRIHGGEVDSKGDHRTAMAFAVAASVADDTVLIQNVENVATSFPDFSGLAQQAGIDIEVCGAARS